MSFALAPSNARAHTLSVPHTCNPVLHRLEGLARLTAEERALVKGLGGRCAPHAPGSEVLGAGIIGGRPQFVVRGWAACQRALNSGGRQIVRLVIPGDLIGLEAGRGPPACAVHALTPLETISAAPLVAAALEGRAPNIARALALSVRQEERQLVDQVVRLGGMAACDRVLDLLGELGQRLEAAGLGHTRRFDLPLTQEHLADTLGLSIVHVHRVLKDLRRDGRIALRAGVVSLRAG